MQPQPIADFEALDPQSLLQPTPFIESDAPEVRRFAEQAVGDAADDLTKGVRLFYAVRDQIRYDPYNIGFSPERYRATTVLGEAGAFCIPKSNLFAAAARAVGIPSAVGFADVKNHLTTEKMRRVMETDVFIYHGYTVLFLAGKWVKATAAFNLSLCERFGVKPLEFDGRADALLHPYDAQQRRHMEYIRERGVFGDFPYREIMAAFEKHYPGYEQRLATRETESRFEDETPLNV